ncbi:MAG: helix-turn-helix transcriptional regulator [Flavobacteriaceae bacterium]|nr:helix-turn-helix transcriptional regulator [Flavobacteriaceae bacterium]
MLVTMVNTEAFSKRLEKVMQHYQLTASAFADSLGVQRSGVSHILSGRNKPSLDFVLKLLHTYPEVDLQWIMNGKGNFPKKIESEKVEGISETEKSDVKVVSHISQSMTNKQVPKIASDKTIRKIVIFYEDGTFEIYQNQT